MNHSRASGCMFDYRQNESTTSKAQSQNECQRESTIITITILMRQKK